MNWQIATAKQKFSQVVRAASEEPQRVFNRSRLVAAVVDGPTFEAFLAWKQDQESRSVADDIAELRALFSDEDDRLEIPERIDRENAFLQLLDDDFEK